MSQHSEGCPGCPSSIDAPVGVHGDCLNFRAGEDVDPKEELGRRENGTVPFGPSIDAPACADRAPVSKLGRFAYSLKALASGIGGWRPGGLRR